MKGAGQFENCPFLCLFFRFRQLNSNPLTLGGARNGPKLPHAVFDRGGTQNGPKLPHTPFAFSHIRNEQKLSNFTYMVTLFIKTIIA